MKSRILMCISETAVWAALALPVQLAAQAQGAEPQNEIEHRRYKLVDIKPLGGPVSGVSSLNSRGMTVGGTATPIPTFSNSNFAVCYFLAAFVFHGFEWRKGVVTDLGALPPAEDNCSGEFSINAKGEIAGASENGEIDPLTGIKESRAVVWKDGKITNLGTFGGNQSFGGAINNRGQVTGVALNAIPDPYSLYDSGFLGGDGHNQGSSNGTQTRAFLWEDGQMQDLGTLGGNDAFPAAINERGQVTGNSYTNTTPNASTGIPTIGPFLWSDGTMTNLGSFGGTQGFAGPLNNRGQVIGISSLPGDVTFDPFLWDQGKLIDLYTDTIGGNAITANALNDDGEIVGGGTFPNRVFDAYVWRNGAATDLGTLDGDCFSEAVAINSSGQVVGYSLSCDFRKQRSFLWEDGSMVDLNTLIPPNSDLQLVQTLAINDRGEIAGDGVPPGCADFNVCGHAFVLVPIGDDDVQGITVGSQNNTARVKQNPASVMPDSPAAKEMMARIRAQLARRYHTPHLSTGPTP
jgi:probable HAF family extracellular repeat protein